MASAKTKKMAVRVNRELLEVAKQQSGIGSTTAVVEYALALLAVPDPVSRYMLLNYGALGPDHALEY
jgi:hypothetical protein